MKQMVMKDETVLENLNTSVVGRDMRFFDSVKSTNEAARQLADEGIPVGVVFANQGQPPSDDCRPCRRRHRIHQREISRLTELVDGVPLRLVESKPSVICGPEALAELGRELWS